MLTILFLMFGLLTTNPQATDSETRNLDSFTELSISGNISVELIASDTHKAEIEILKGDIDKLVTSVKGSTLKIKFKNKDGWNWGGNQNKAKITLHYVKLDGIDASAGSKVSCKDAIAASDFELDASSGSSIKIELDTESLDVDVSSGASIKVYGVSDIQSVDISSGASYHASDLESKKCTVEASSGASAKIWVSQTLSADASSGASIRYKGDPEDTNLDPGKYSGGSIRKM